MQQEVVAMTNRDIDRITLIRQFIDNKLSLVHAAKALGMAERHFRRLVRQFQQMGPVGVVSAKRGRPSNNRISNKLNCRLSLLFSKIFMIMAQH